MMGLDWNCGRQCLLVVQEYGFTGGRQACLAMLEIGIVTYNASDRGGGGHTNGGAAGPARPGNMERQDG